AARQRLLDLGTHEMVLEPAQRGAVELGVAAHPAGGVDQREAVPDARAELARHVGPAERIGGQQIRDQQRLPLEAAGDFVLEVAAQQPVGGNAGACHTVSSSWARLCTRPSRSISVVSSLN